MRELAYSKRTMTPRADVLASVAIASRVVTVDDESPMDIGAALLPPIAARSSVTTTRDHFHAPVHQQAGHNQERGHKGQDRLPAGMTRWDRGSADAHPETLNPRLPGLTPGPRGV